MKKAPRRKEWFLHAKLNRERLFAIDQHCHWCGVLTIAGKGGGQRLATLDHVKSWPECYGIEEWSSESNMVLACYACNQKRGQEWQSRTNNLKPLSRVTGCAAERNL